MKKMTIANEDTTPYFNRNKCYFTFGYFDTNYEYPVIDTYIYLGNASELKDKIPTKECFLYFQDADSFANHGFLNSKRHKLENGEMRIWEICEAEAEKELLNYDKLIQVLKECEN